MVISKINELYLQGGRTFVDIYHLLHTYIMCLQKVLHLTFKFLRVSNNLYCWKMLIFLNILHSDKNFVGGYLNIYLSKVASFC